MSATSCYDADGILLFRREWARRGGKYDAQVQVSLEHFPGMADDGEHVTEDDDGGDPRTWCGCADCKSWRKQNGGSG